MPEEVEAGKEVEANKAEEQPVSVKEPVEKKDKAKAAAGKPSGAAEVKGRKAVAIDDIMTAIKNLTVLELSKLVKTLEDEFGVSAAPAVVAAAAPAEGAATAVEEQTEFDVILKEIGANKISVIRAVRELTTLGLKESKDLVEGAPKPVKEGVSKDDAAAAKGKLEAAGATAEIK